MSDFITKTAEQYRNDFLNFVRAGLITRLGIQNPNVSFGTDHYLIGEAIGQIAYNAAQNGVAKADQQMVDTAIGEDLYRIGRIYNLSLRPAGPSTGALVLSSSLSPLGITSGQQLIDAQGLRYQVNIGGSFSNGGEIKIISIDTGSGTNISEGTVLRWVSPPAFVNPTALVSVGGLTGGVDAEDDEGLRDRILSRIRYPIGGGNWAQFADAAEKSSTSVQKAFVFPAYNGPSTVQVCVVRKPTATNKNRNVDSLIVSNTVKPAVQAIVFEGINIAVTTPTNQATDVSIGLSLPASPSASIPGPGGGWLDGSPWPTYSSLGYAEIYSVTTTTEFVVYADQEPLDGVSRFVFVNPSTFKITHSKVISHGDLGGNKWFVRVDTPCVGITVGCWLFPDAVNIDTYIEALLNIFVELGPGQISDFAGTLPTSYRRPYVSDSFPSDIGPSVLKFLVKTSEEILDVQYLYVSDTTPNLPADVDNGPAILVPQLIGFYPLS